MFFESVKENSFFPTPKLPIQLKFNLYLLELGENIVYLLSARFEKGRYYKWSQHLPIFYMMHTKSLW